MRVKNKSDLSEFPDGGRATLVRRYSPTLTHRLLRVLTECPYDEPSYINAAAGVDRHCAIALTRYGLLERNPTSRDVFRVTEAGAEVVARWKAAGFLP